MAYETAISRAWSELTSFSPQSRHTVRFLADNYDVDVAEQRILSLSCNVVAKPHLSILILHYLVRSLKGLPAISGEWISFKKLSGGQGYYPTFKKRVIDIILRKYKDNPQGLWELTERLPAKRTQVADISVALEPFAGAPILITFWRGDEEFGPEVNLLFDKNISQLFCTEDIVVLAEVVAHSI